MGAFTKKIGRTAFVQSVAAGAIAGMVHALKSTTYWSTENEAVVHEAWQGRSPVIVAFWHNRLAMMPMCWQSRKPFHMLISAHPDGRLISRAVKYFGISTVAGSSTRGGTDALRSLLQRLRAGESVGITPDGPRGPRMRARDGAIALARLSGAPILPASISVSRRRVLNTWDRLIVPVPFGRGAMVWGDPIFAPRETDEKSTEDLRLQLEASLNHVSALADKLAGHRPMDPAIVGEPTGHSA